MLWRLIGFIVLFVFFRVFICFNLENRCDISFWFSKPTFHQVPVYLTAFSSFVLGMLWAVAYIIFSRFKRKSGPDAKGKKKQSPKKGQPEEAAEQPPLPGGPYGID
jgi:uncharacterized integral membrane protein